MERLSEDDARILRLETEAIKGHTMKLIVAAPRPDGSAIDAEELRRAIEPRLGREPRARQRVVFAPGPAGGAAWADDPDFDLRNHVGEIAAGGALDRDGLLEAAAKLFERRLDHERPLWRVDVARMRDGGTAALLRIHHCLADGITSLRFGAELLWDSDPAPPEGRARPWSPAPGPSALGLVADAARRQARAVPGAVSGVARVAADPSRWSEGARELVRLPGAIARELTPLGGGEQPLDRHLGPRRELALARSSLDELKGIAHLASRATGTHVTLNDVLLAAVAGGLRRWKEIDSARATRLRVQIPVSLHAPGEGGGLGNRDSFMNADLRLDVADPLERLRLINEEISTRKHAGDPKLLYDFFHAISRFGPLYRGVTRLASGPREFALSVSNVPGPSALRYLLGAPVLELASFAEPADRHALRISAMSYAETMAISLTVDPDAIGGAEELASAIEREIANLALELA